MGRLTGWAGGLESTSIEWGFLAVDSAAISTTINRHTGGRSLQIGGATPLVSGERRGVSQDFANPAGNGPYFARAYMYSVTRPSAENTILVFVNTATNIVWITKDSGGLLRLYDEDGVIGSPSEAIALDVFTPRIEIMVDRTPAAGSHVVRGYINGVEFAGATDRNLGIGLTGFRFGGNLAAEAQTQGEWYFTDVAVNDSAGSVQNGLPGHCSGTYYIRPAGAGDAAATAGTFADIDEITPNDATDFIQIDTNIAANYTGGPYPGDANDTIVLVSVNTRQRAETAASAGWTCQIKSQSGGTTQTGSAKTHDDTAWKTNGDISPRNPSLISYTDPQTGGPWTPATLSTAVFGVDVTDANPDLHITAIWLMVEFVRAPVKLPKAIIHNAVHRAATY